MCTEKSTRLFSADDLIQFRILSKTNKLKIALEIILLPVRIKKKRDRRRNFFSSTKNANKF